MFPKIFTHSRRIGLIGLADSGKTVLLTSLINHLKDHDPEQFSLSINGKSDNQIHAFEEQEVEGVPFDYESHRSALGHGQWLAKTTDRHEYRCGFHLSDWSLTKAELHFYDFPGERLADVLMCSPRYEDWSDALLKQFSTYQEYRSLTQPYLDVLARGDLTETAVLTGYRRTLARLLVCYRPLVTPSVFRLDTSGVSASSRKLEKEEEQIKRLSNERLCGLSAAQQFAPLSLEARARHGEITDRFSQHYSAYRTAVVDPLFTDLAQCDQWVVLVDVPRLLTSGAPAFNDFQTVLEYLLRLCRPGSRFWKRLLGAVHLDHWCPRDVDRICFVANKADLVHPDDTDRLVALVRDMARRLMRDLRGIEKTQLGCAPVRSTRCATPGEDKLLGHPMFDMNEERIARGTDPVLYTISRLPTDGKWPPDWQPGQYSYPTVYPGFARRHGAPPEQIGLDRMLRFILEIE